MAPDPDATLRGRDAILVEVAKRVHALRSYMRRASDVEICEQLDSELSDWCKASLLGYALARCLRACREELASVRDVSAGRTEAWHRLDGVLEDAYGMLIASDPLTRLFRQRVYGRRRSQRPRDRR